VLLAQGQPQRRSCDGIAASPWSRAPTQAVEPLAAAPLAKAWSNAVDNAGVAVDAGDANDAGAAFRPLLRGIGAGAALPYWFRRCAHVVRLGNRCPPTDNHCHTHNMDIVFASLIHELAKLRALNDPVLLWLCAFGLPRLLGRGLNLLHLGGHAACQPNNICERVKTISDV